MLSSFFHSTFSSRNSVSLLSKSNYLPNPRSSWVQFFILRRTGYWSTPLMTLTSTIPKRKNSVSSCPIFLLMNFLMSDATNTTRKKNRQSFHRSSHLSNLALMWPSFTSGMKRTSTRILRVWRNYLLIHKNPTPFLTFWIVRRCLKKHRKKLR